MASLRGGHVVDVQAAVIVLTIGTFDGLHPGHLELLKGCRDLVGVTGKVFVGVNRDEFVTRYKGHKPNLTLAYRCELLTALRDVDAVFVNIGDEDSGVLIDVVQPDAVAIGDDWLDPGHDERRYLKQLGISKEWLDVRGLKVTYVPRTRGVSSSGLRTLTTAHVS